MLNKTAIQSKQLIIKEPFGNTGKLNNITALGAGLRENLKDEALSRLNSIKLSPEEAFFSDTISHSTYYRYLNVLRERKINFGYIHGVNIENNINNLVH